MEQFEHEVTAEESGQRLDRVLSAACKKLSRSALQSLIADGCVLCNQKTANKKDKVQAGDQLWVEIPDATPIAAIAQAIPLPVIYEDAHLLVVNKPKGMVVHPAPGNPDGTMVNALLYHCGSSLSGIGGEIRPGIVHRIDKDTSGLLVVAKDDKTHIGLSEQMSVHSINRVYHAVVYGRLREDSGFVEAPIGRDKNDRKKMAVTQINSKYAYTSWQVLERFQNFTYIACRLKTGRTHQIRVHMASIGHPLAGDAVYGPKNCIKQLGGQCLHAKVLGFTHPITGEYLEFDAPLPEYFVAYLNQLRKGEPNHAQD